MVLLFYCMYGSQRQHHHQDTQMSITTELSLTIPFIAALSTTIVTFPLPVNSNLPSTYTALSSMMGRQMT
jgi:hypothetical protein